MRYVERECSLIDFALPPPHSSSQSWTTEPTAQIVVPSPRPALYDSMLPCSRLVPCRFGKMSADKLPFFRLLPCRLKSKTAADAYRTADDNCPALSSRFKVRGIHKGERETRNPSPPVRSLVTFLRKKVTPSSYTSNRSIRLIVQPSGDSKGGGSPPLGVFKE